MNRAAEALWGMFCADALAMPTHWFYGGNSQVRQTFGGNLTGYTKPPQHLQGSIMALSNTGGAGRGSSDGDIVGSIINHGKKKYWERGGQYHYHCTLAAGENTLEAEIARVFMRGLANKPFNEAGMRDEYVKFMTTPGSHNDAYASSYHRMFFANRANGRALASCPDNDKHNVDAIDGLIVPAVVLIALQGSPDAVSVAQQAVRVTRNSQRVEAYVPYLARLLDAAFKGDDMAKTAQAVAKDMGVGGKLDPRAADPVVACYIDSNFVSMLHFLAKYGDFKSGALANANCGGENVHRGLVLGAVLGAAHGVPEDLKSGLKNADTLGAEIRALVGKKAEL